LKIQEIPISGIQIWQPEIHYFNELLMGKSTYQLVIFPLPRAAPPGPPTHSEPVLAPTRPRRTKHDFCDQHIFGQRWENGTFLKFYHQNTGNMRIEAIKGMILRKHLGLKPWFSRFSCGFSLIQLLDSWFQAHPPTSKSFWDHQMS